MEHTTIIPLENGFFRIVPDEGYVLYDAATGICYTEAVTKNINKFSVREAHN